MKYFSWKLACMGGWVLFNSHLCSKLCSLVEVVPIYRQSFFLLIASFPLVSYPAVSYPCALENTTEIQPCYFVFLSNVMLFVYSSLFDLLCGTRYWFIYRIICLGKNGLLSLCHFLWNIIIFFQHLSKDACSKFSSLPFLHPSVWISFSFGQLWPCNFLACQEEDVWITHLWGSSSSALEVSWQGALHTAWGCVPSQKNQC